MYTKVSIPKNGDGAGCPVSRSSNIIIIDVDDIKVEPTREVGNTALKGDLELERAQRPLQSMRHPLPLLRLRSFPATLMRAV